MTAGSQDPPVPILRGSVEWSLPATSVSPFFVSESERFDRLKYRILIRPVDGRRIDKSMMKDPVYLSRLGRTGSLEEDLGNENLLEISGSTPRKIAVGTGKPAEEITECGNKLLDPDFWPADPQISPSADLCGPLFINHRTDIVIN